MEAPQKCLLSGSPPLVPPVMTWAQALCVAHQQHPADSPPRNAGGFHLRGLKSLVRGTAWAEDRLLKHRLDCRVSHTQWLFRGVSLPHSPSYKGPTTSLSSPPILPTQVV